jgi:hypothetical protein
MKAGELLVDMDQLLDRLSWVPTKESAQFIIRAVIQKGLVEKAGIQGRRGRNRVCYKLTPAGMLVVDPRAPMTPGPEQILFLRGEPKNKKIEDFSFEDSSIPGVLIFPVLDKFLA